MRIIEHAGFAELLPEAAMHIFARLEALGTDMRPDVDVQLRGSTLAHFCSIGLSQRFGGLHRDKVVYPAPSGMHHRKPARWGNHYHGNAIGKAQQRRNARHTNQHAIGAFGGKLLRGFSLASIANIHQRIAMNLVGNNERRICAIE